jgi:hypothetical protein
MIESGAFQPSNYIGTRNTFAHYLSKVKKRKKPIKVGSKGSDLGGAGKYFDVPASLAEEDSKESK